MSDQTKQDMANARNAALGLLARREHSRRELATKLRKRVDSPQQLEELLDRLTNDGLLSDRRFAESFCRSSLGRGRGAARIRRDLQQRGVDSELIVEALEGLEVDWFDAALQVRRRRFGSAAPADRKEWARQARFLQYRGFSSDQVQDALKARPDEDESF